jgi:type IV secretory pathway VirD2 relaxase
VKVSHLKKSLFDLAESSRESFSEKDKDIRAALKLPARSTNNQKQVARAFSKIQKILRSSRSSSARARSSAKSKFQRGVGKGAKGASQKILQRSAVRWSFSNSKTSGQWGAHGKYLERESAQELEQEKDKNLDPSQAAEPSEKIPVLGFGSAGDKVPISSTLSGWQEAGDEHMFKIIISPEFGDKMDLKRAVYEQMSAMEKDLGTKLQWVGISHHNTDNPHVHVAVRGIDENGKKLEINPGYIKEGSRIRAQEAATRQLGYRSQRDVAEGLARQVTQQRFTDIDRMLIRQAKDQSIDFSGPLPKTDQMRELRMTQIRRLAQLEKIGLARKTSTMAWSLSPDLENALRQAQVSQDRLKTKFAHKEMVSDPQAQLVNTQLKPGERVTGRLIGTGLNEATNKPYLLVEGIDGKLHFMNQGRDVEKLRASNSLKIGNFIEISANDKGFQSVKNFGQSQSTEFIDQQIASSTHVPERMVTTQTVTGRFRMLINDRVDALERLGIIKREGQIIVSLDQKKLDFEHAKEIGPLDIDPKGAQLLVVQKKGLASVIAKNQEGRVVQVGFDELQARGLNPRYIDQNSMVFQTASDALKPFATLIKPESLSLSINEKNPNKLDLIVRQIPNLPVSHPAKDLFEARKSIWKGRGVDLMDSNFAVQAGGYKKNQELVDLAKKMGSEKVMEDLASQKAKGSQIVDSKPGLQVTGRVRLVHTTQSGVSEIVLDSGKEMILIKQPGSQEIPKMGQRIRAVAQEIEDKNNQQRLRLWRFADLELQQAKTKTKEKSKDRGISL